MGFCPRLLLFWARTKKHRKGLFMDNKNTEEMGNQTETETTGSENENITLTADELAKRIQSETDKVRTKYSKEIKELKERLKWNVTAILLSEYQLKLVTEGCSIDDINYLSSKFKTSPEDEYRLLNELYKFPEVVKGVQTGEESGAWED